MLEQMDLLVVERGLELELVKSKEGFGKYSMEGFGKFRCYLFPNELELRFLFDLALDCLN